MRLAKETGMMCLAVIIAFFLCAWLGGGINNNVNAIIKERALAQRLQVENDVASKLVADYNTVAASQSEIQRAFPPENNILEFVAAIDSIAAKHSLPHSIHFDSPIKTGKTLESPSQPLTQVTFNLSLQSNIYIFDEFLKDLEHLPYFVNITSISITSQTPKGWMDTSNITIQGILYTRGDTQ